MSSTEPIPSEASSSAEPAVPSKKALKKLEKEKKKAEAKQARAQQQQARQAEQKGNEVDQSEGKYGANELNQSRERPGRVFTEIQNLSPENVDQVVLVRCRVHSVRDKGNLVFFVLRQRFHTIQAIACKGPNSRQMLKFISKVTPESIVDVEAKVRAAEVGSCTVGNLELEIASFFVVSAAASPLPILLEDAERPEPLLEEQREAVNQISARLSEAQEKLATAGEDADKAALEKAVADLEDEKQRAIKYVDLSRKMRLDNRIIDLRTTTNQAIFRIQSAVCELFREHLLGLNFTEIHTPKLIGTASEGGADVFKLGYFGRDAYLAQSPQLYKQMCICADMGKVFEIAPVFRSENSNTHRHMTEFIGLDLEFAFNEHYHEVLDLLEGLFFFVFEQINSRFATELRVIHRQYPFEPLLFNRASPLRLTHKDAVDLLKTVNPDIEYGFDIGTTDEKRLGKIVHEKYQTDFYVIDKFPLSQRPFYTMPDPADPEYSNSYDIFIRGEEILSGAQRIHDPEMLTQSAERKGVDVSKLKDYIDAFRFGAPPHGGGGIGLERVVMLFLGLPNIRLTSLFPRTPDRITP